MAVFRQLQLGNNPIYYRVFDQSVDSELLVWHRDKNNRHIFVLDGNSWQLQIDNKLPTVLIPGGTYFIPKESYHRIIKGVENLSLIIIEDV